MESSIYIFIVKYETPTNITWQTNSLSFGRLPTIHRCLRGHRHDPASASPQFTLPQHQQQHSHSKQVEQTISTLAREFDASASIRAPYNLRSVDRRAPNGNLVCTLFFCVKYWSNASVCVCVDFFFRFVLSLCRLCWKSPQARHYDSMSWALIFRPINYIH